MEERDQAWLDGVCGTWKECPELVLVFVDEGDRAVMAAGAWRIAEVHVALDAAWMSPRWRLEGLRALHEAMRLELAAAGYREAVTWFEVSEMVRGLGRAWVRRLLHEFGWVQSERVSVHRRVP